MNLVKLNEFSREIICDKSIMSQCVSLNVYHFFDGSWFEGETKLDNKKLCSDLKKTEEEKNCWRHNNDVNTYFYVDDLDAIVKIKFSSPTTSAQRLKIDKAIWECVIHASNSYNAYHDSLTGLLNKKGFNELLQEVVSIESIDETADNSLSAFVTANSLVSLLSFDVDNFKQINDSYGHQYGDVVLRCFSSRLEKRIQELNNRDYSAYISRTGGEEFSVLIEGNISKNEVFKIAEMLRTIISGTSLPNDDEWEQIAQDILPDDNVKPHISERKITTSVGIAYLVLNKDLDNFDKQIDKLIAQSDLALFRAKLANQAIDAKGENKDLNTTVYWQNKGQFEMIKELIKGAKYIETEMYF